MLPRITRKYIANASDPPEPAPNFRAFPPRRRRIVHPFAPLTPQGSAFRRRILLAQHGAI